MAEYDYPGAGRRHYDDAERLLETGEKRAFGNADHLYGFSAECYLVAILQALGLEDRDRDGVQGDARRHIDQLWPVAVQRLQGAGRVGSALLARIGETNPFRNWRVQDRYATEGRSDRSVVAEHRRAAERLATELGRAKTGAGS